MSAFNGSGTYVITGVGLPYVTNTTISSTVANQLNTDLASGLSTTICKDGQTTPTANLPMATFKHTGAGAASGTGQYLVYGQSAGSLAGLTLTAGLIGTSSTLTGNSVAASFINTNGNFSLPQLSATTFTALPSVSTGSWLVSCQFQISDAVNFGQMAVVIQDNGAIGVTNLVPGSHISISSSGLNLQATNNFASGTQTAYWAYVRIAT